MPPNAVNGTVRYLVISIPTACAFFAALSIDFCKSPNPFSAGFLFSSVSITILPSAIVSPPFPAYISSSLEVLFGAFLERLISAHPLDLFTDSQNQLGEVARDDHDRRGALINLLECSLPQKGIKALAK